MCVIVSKAIRSLASATRASRRSAMASTTRRSVGESCIGATVARVSVSFAGHELHSPRFALEDARELARDRFGVDGSASELGSHQDQNVLVDTGSGRFVLKIANAAFGEAELDLQNRAMTHLGERHPLEVPQPCLALDGSELVAVERDGVTYLLRLVTFIEGEMLLDAAASRARGAQGARRGGGPCGARAPGLRPPCRGSRDAVGSPSRRARRRGTGVACRGPARRALATRVADAAAEAIERLAPSLPRQVIHGDVTDWNVIGRRDRAGLLMPCGLIDFGDITRTLRVCELAVAASIAYGHDPDEPIAAAAEIVRGVRRRLPARGRRARGAPAPHRGARRDRRRRHRAAGGARAAQRLCPARARG